MPTAAKVYTMLDNASLWAVAQQCHRVLTDANIPYAVVGGVAVCLHGYQRNTVDLDLLLHHDHLTAAKGLLEQAGLTWDDEHKELRTAEGVAVQFLATGEKAGKGVAVLLPDPAEEGATSEIEGLRVLSLARLIESKLACGQGNPRRTYRDFADVVELIAAHNLSRSFARYLHKDLRDTFRELVLRARRE